MAGRGLGIVVPARPAGPIVQRLTPTPEAAAHPRSLSALHGLDAFPLHTDGAYREVPPRYVVLRCEAPGPADRPTVLVDSRALELSARVLRAIKRSVWVVRSGSRSFLASVLSDRVDGRHIRWDRGCMEPAHPRFEAAGQALDAAAAALPTVKVHWEEGHGVVLDNWRLVHGRAAAAADDAGERQLDRVLVASGAAW